MKYRTEERVPLNVLVAARTPTATLEVTIVDLSCTGCKMHVIGSIPRVGESILLTLSAGDEVAGQIIWRDGEEYGVKFYKEIDERVIDRVSLRVA